MIIAAFNKDTPSKVRALIFLACLYILSPADIIPDIIPFAGVMDDMVIIPAAVYGLRQLLPARVAISSEQRADYVIKRGGIIAAIGALAVIFWVSLIFYAFYKLLL